MTADLDNATLEAVAQRLERRSGNAVYRKAWRAAARVVRNMRRDAEVNRQDEEVNREPKANHV